MATDRRGRRRRNKAAKLRAQIRKQVEPIRAELQAAERALHWAHREADELHRALRGKVLVVLDFTEDRVYGQCGEETERRMEVQRMEWNRGVRPLGEPLCIAMRTDRHLTNSMNAQQAADFDRRQHERMGAQLGVALIRDLAPRKPRRY